MRSPHPQYYIFSALSSAASLSSSSAASSSSSSAASLSSSSAASSSSSSAASSSSSSAASSSSSSAASSSSSSAASSSSSSAASSVAYSHFYSAEYRAEFKVDIQLMIRAIQDNNYSEVYNLLKKAERKNYDRHNFFNSKKILFYACYDSRANIFSLLLDFGADWTIVDEMGQTLLFSAMKNGAFMVAQMLLQTVSKKKVVSSRYVAKVCDSGAVLGAAALTGACENPAEFQTSCTAYGATALSPCYDFNESVATFLDHRNINNENVLSIMCLTSNVKGVFFLLEIGANVRTVDKWGQTPLIIASGGYGTTEIVKQLIKKMSGGLCSSSFSASSAALGAAAYFQVKQLREYLDQKDEFGKTALHYACNFGNIEVVDILIGFGANWKVVDNNGETPLS